MLALLAFVAIPVAMDEAIGLIINRDALKRARIDQLEVVADLKVKKIEDFVNSRKGDLIIVREYQEIKQFFADPNNAGDKAYHAAPEKTLDQRLAAVIRAYQYDDILLVSKNGKVIYCSNPTHASAHIGRGLPDPGNKAFLEGRKDIYFTDIFENKLEPGHYYMLVSGPVSDDAGKSLGVLAFEVKMDPIYELIQDTANLGKTGETLIAKNIGDGALYLNPLRHDPNAALKREVKFGDKLALSTQLSVKRPDGSGITNDYRGETVIAAWRYIPDLKWGLVAKIDTREAFAPAYSLIKIVVLFALVTLGLAAVVALFVSRSLTAPLRDLQAGTEIIGRGNLDHKVGTLARDEIGQLSRSFDLMTANLKQIEASRRETEERLRLTLEDLKRSNKELEQFAYVASHDLQEPLRMVASFTQLLEQRYKDKLDKDANEFIGYAVNGANRMQGLINDLLTYSRVGTRGKAPEPADSHSALGEAVLNLETMIRENHAVITNDDLPEVRADRSQLVQVFQNLIGNAIKFKSEETPRIHLSAREAPGEWIFSVKDNGVGIDPQYFERIFVVFQRLHSREEYPGTGIGLALCKRIVERHGGKIWVESAPGKGSTFFFTIPN